MVICYNYLIVKWDFSTDWTTWNVDEAHLMINRWLNRTEKFAAEIFSQSFQKFQSDKINLPFLSRKTCFHTLKRKSFLAQQLSIVILFLSPILIYCESSIDNKSPTFSLDAQINCRSFLHRFMKYLFELCWQSFPTQSWSINYSCVWNLENSRKLKENCN